MKWAALFSQTGSEICNLSEAIGQYPDLVISDNVNEANIIDSRIELNCKKLLWRKYKGLTTEEKLDYYRKHLSDYDIITLHGWLNIVPAVICNEYKIYNGHPGLITRYPELKGKDPQIRFAENIQNYPIYGSVVHRVTPEVDEGEVVSVCEKNTPTSSPDCFSILKETSLEAWIEFFDSYITIKL